MVYNRKSYNGWFGGTTISDMLCHVVVFAHHGRLFWRFDVKAWLHVSLSAVCFVWFYPSNRRPSYANDREHRVISCFSGDRLMDRDREFSAFWPLLDWYLCKSSVCSGPRKDEKARRRQYVSFSFPVSALFWLGALLCSCCFDQKVSENRLSSHQCKSGKCMKLQNIHLSLPYQ